LVGIIVEGLIFNSMSVIYKVVYEQKKPLSFIILPYIYKNKSRMPLCHGLFKIIW